MSSFERAAPPRSPHHHISMPSAPASRMYSDRRDAHQLFRALGEIVEEGLVEIAVG